MSKSPAKADNAPVSDPEAFAFVQALAAELSTGKVELPSFPDIAMRVRQVLADETVTPEKVVRVVGSEPALAARLLQLANSAALNFSGKAVTDLRTAVNRMGFNMVRSAAIAFAMSQLKKVDALKGLEKPLDALWRRSAGPLPLIPLATLCRKQCTPIGKPFAMSHSRADHATNRRNGRG